MTKAKTDSLLGQGATTDSSATSTDEFLNMLQISMERISVISAIENSPTPDMRDKGVVALFTGSTGALGSYFLDVPLFMVSIAHVYCLTILQKLKIAKPEIIKLIV
jgi:hypothetical protein